jgi:hypothetical protein
MPVCERRVVSPALLAGSAYEQWEEKTTAVPASAGTQAELPVLLKDSRYGFEPSVSVAPAVLAREEAPVIWTSRRRPVVTS